MFKVKEGKNEIFELINFNPIETVIELKSSEDSEKLISG